jgi:hypothetical protein
LLFQRAAEGKPGEEALLAIGDAYIDEMLSAIPNRTTAAESAIITVATFLYDEWAG